MSRGADSDDADTQAAPGATRSVSGRTTIDPVGDQPASLNSGFGQFRATASLPLLAQRVRADSSLADPLAGASWTTSGRCEGAGGDAQRGRSSGATAHRRLKDR